MLRLNYLLRELLIRPFYTDSVCLILLPGDVVVPKCLRSELLLEFTTLRPVRPWWCMSVRVGYVAG